MKFYLRFGTSYVNLITSSVHSIEMPPTFIVNLFKGHVSFGSLELAVGAVAIVSSEATKELKSLQKQVNNSSSSGSF